MFKKRKLAKRLARIGSAVDVSFLLYVNNQEGISFSSYNDALSYLREYRSNNVISRLQIYRIETYSL